MKRLIILFFLCSIILFGCPPEDDPCESTHFEILLPDGGTAANEVHYGESPFQIKWLPDCIQSISIDIYNNGTLLRTEMKENGEMISLNPSIYPYELKLWVNENVYSLWIFIIPEFLDDYYTQLQCWGEPSGQGGEAICIAPYPVDIVGAHDQAIVLERAGDPYANNHYYFNLPFSTKIRKLTMTMRFLFTIHDISEEYIGNPVIQALEVSMSTWHNNIRHELAAQIEVVPDNTIYQGDTPAYRLWLAPEQGEHPLWYVLDAPAAQNIFLEKDKWHTLQLSGNIYTDNIQYSELIVNDKTYDLSSYSTPPVPYIEQINSKITVAVQLDGNVLGDEYSIYIDDLWFKTEPK